MHATPSRHPSHANRHGALPTLLLLVPAALAAPQEPQEPQEETRPKSHAATLVDTYLEPYLSTGNFSGSILIAREGRVLFEGGFGFADAESERPNTTETSFYLASTSRIFTSAAVLLLEQDGKLAVTDPLSKHLPDWPRGDEITLHHLLTLSAGFPNINQLPGYGRWSRSPQTPATLCAKFRDLPLEFPPGARSVHSNSNYNVLALLIEEVSGLSFGDFLEKRFFEPLGMTRSGHDADSTRAVPHRALGYRPTGIAALVPHGGLQWSVKTGNGSIYSTVRDLYRFDRMLVGGTILREDAVAKLFTEYFPQNGYGWFVGERFGSQEVSITGRSPGFGSSWRRLVEPDVTVLVLGNIYNGVPGTVARDLVSLAMREVPEPPPIRADPPDPDLVGAAVGTYRFGPDFYNPDGSVRVHAEDGHLFNGDGWLIPAGGTTFIHRTYWSTLTFERGEDDEIARLRYDDFVGERVR